MKKERKKEICGDWKYKHMPYGEVSEALLKLEKIFEKHRKAFIEHIEKKYDTEIDFFKISDLDDPDYLRYLNIYCGIYSEIKYVLMKEKSGYIYSYDEGVVWRGHDL